MSPESFVSRAAGSLLGGCLALLLALLAVPSAVAAGEVRAENALPGSPGWRYAEATRGTVADQYAGTVRSIDGYADRTSVAPGDALTLRVSSVAGVAYRVEVYRLGWYGGAGARRVACVPGCAGSRAGVQQPAPPAPDAATGVLRAGWAATDVVQVGAGWVPGYYIAQLVITAGTDAGKARWVPFVVRGAPGDATPLVVQVPVNTWQAYNGWGGRSLYDNKSVTGVRASKVSFDRPYWANMFDLFDHEYQLVRYLEREGLDVTYVADTDVDADPGVLLGRRAVLVNGHGEYWTMRQRDAMDGARAAGVSLGFIGANIGYWHVRYEDARRTLVGYKSVADPVADPGMKTVQFRDLGRPECRLLGVQYQDTWATDSADRRYAVDPVGAADPWLAGTGLGAGATVAGTVGYEWDRIQPGCATRPLTRLFTWDDPGDALLGADAVRYTAASGARVFAAGSMQFAFGLDGWRSGGTGTADPRLQEFMRRMLADMGAPAPPPSPDRPPAASFTVSPGAPVTGQAVTLTDTSTDDGEITARSWDLDGDGAYGDATGPVVFRTYAAAGTFTVGLRVTDDAGAAAVTTRTVTVTAAPAPQPVVNLLVNPGFETSTTGWSGWQASITRVPLAPAPGGAWVARVAQASGTSYSIGETTGAVRGQVQSTRVNASVWVAAANAQTVGRPVVLRVRERTTAGTLVRETSSPAVLLGTAFQRVQVSTTTAQTGGVVDVRVSQTNAAAGDALYADEFAVSTGDPTPPPNTPPAAAFAVTPTAPVTGQAVTLTDTSTDADGTVTGRSWDLDGDGTYGDATGPVATVTWPTAGERTVGLRVTDDRGATTQTTRTLTVTAAPPAVNLVANPGFETGLTGWTGWQATVTRVALAGAPGGAYVARVARSTGTGDSIGESAGSVRNRPAGTGVTASAWVAAAATQTAGRVVVLRLRERTTAGTLVRETASAPLTLTGAFTRIQATATTVGTGNVVDVRVSQTGAVAGDAFYADEFSVTTG